MFGGTDVTLPARLVDATNDLFDGDPAARGVTYDLATAMAMRPYDAGRYAAVVRKPTGVLVLGGFPSDAMANAAITTFWDGMRALLAPAKS